MWCSFLKNFKKPKTDENITFTIENVTSPKCLHLKPSLIGQFLFITTINFRCRSHGSTLYHVETPLHTNTTVSTKTFTELYLIPTFH